MSNRERVLVTGGTGFLGSALVRRLVHDGQQVRVLDNNWRGLASRLTDLRDRIDLVPADIRDPRAVHDALNGIDTVWHLASVNGTEHFYQQPDLVLDVGVRGMLNVLDALPQASVRNLFVASSSEVYQSAREAPADESVPLAIPDVLNPRFTYAGAKIIGELMALHWAKEHVERVAIFRPHNVYGPDMGTEHVIPQFALRMADLAKRTRGTLDFPIEGSGRETRAFIYIDDCIEGLMCLRDRGQDQTVYHVGTQEQLDVATIAREVARCFEREIRIVPGELKEGSVSRRCPDVTRLRNLGFRPQVSLRAGLEKTVRWYRDNLDGYRDARRVA